MSSKIAKYDPSDNTEASEFGTFEKISFSELVFRFSSRSDKMMFVIGWIASTFVGAALPGFSLIWGDMIDSIGGAKGDLDTLETQALYMGYVGVGTFVFCYFQVGFFSIFAENISHKIKVNYFRACLAKDASWFDSNNPTEMAAKIAKETSAIQRGIGDKIGNILMNVSSFVCGFAFAFYWGYKLTLILLAAFPLMAIVGIALGTFMEDGFKENMKAYA